MSKSGVTQYFNPDQHLVLHQDNDGNMIGGGYQVNNLLYQHKMPLFVSLDDTERQNGGGGGVGGGGGGEDDHFIPEKFSDLFRDLAVPAGLFMMPALFKPRNYAFEVPEQSNAHPDADAHADADAHPDADADSDTDSDTDDNDRRKPVPKDIFDRLLELVTPSERVQHDVKTRRQRLRHSKERHTNNTTKSKRGGRRGRE